MEPFQLFLAELVKKNPALFWVLVLLGAAQAIGVFQNEIETMVSAVGVLTQAILDVATILLAAPFKLLVKLLIVLADEWHKLGL